MYCLCCTLLPYSRKVIGHIYEDSFNKTEIYKEIFGDNKRPAN